MKNTILFLFIIISACADAQSLKDALYGGKLKTDSGSVLRKGDDLSSKIDTTTKKKPEPEKNKPGVVSMDASGVTTSPASDSTAAPTDNSTITKDNNKVWKEFTASVITILKQEVMPSKKIKKGEYYILVDYEIGVDGQVTIPNVYITPENKYIEEQVKERFGIDTPKLNPAMSSGKPRKSVKRSNFTITKE